MRLIHASYKGTHLISTDLKLSLIPSMILTLAHMDFQSVQKLLTSQR